MCDILGDNLMLAIVWLDIMLVSSRMDIHMNILLQDMLLIMGNILKLAMGWTSWWAPGWPSSRWAGVVCSTSGFSWGVVVSLLCAVCLTALCTWFVRCLLCDTCWIEMDWNTPCDNHLFSEGLSSFIRGLAGTAGLLSTAWEAIRLDVILLGSLMLYIMPGKTRLDIITMGVIMLDIIMLWAIRQGIMLGVVRLDIFT